MKVLMTSDTYLPRLGGGEYHVFYLLSGLRAQGIDACLYTTEAGVSSDDASLHVVRLPYTGIASTFVIWRALWKASAETDIIHSHYSYRLSFLAGCVAWLRGKPFAVTQHGLGLLPQPGSRGVYKLIFHVWRYWSMRWASVIISTSEDMSIVIRRCGFGNKIVPISNGYDATLFKPLPVLQQGARLLTVRRFTPKTGLQYLVAALPAIIKAIPSVHLDMVGDGPLRLSVEELARRLGVEEHCTFHASVSHERILHFYTQASVVVLPSTAESTSLTCIEAMACQKVIVASRVGGLIELLGADQARGYLVPLTGSQESDYNAPFTLSPEKIALLSSAIIYALRHPDESDAKARAAATYARSRYSWETIIGQTIEVYRKTQA